MEKARRTDIESRIAQVVHKKTNLFTANMRLVSRKNDFKIILYRVWYFMMQ